jgi:hypothetical protein
MIADVRDTTADERDEKADEREVALDEWERRLETRAAKLGLADRTFDERDRAATLRSEARVAREAQHQARDDRRGERDGASAARDQASWRRQMTTPRTGLAMAFAEIARQLYLAESFDDVLGRIAAAAVSAVVGCDMVSVAMRESGAFRTNAATEAAAAEVDLAQFEVGEGPCLDAVDAPVVYAPAFPDQRWPRFDSRPIDSGVYSAVSYQLAPSGPETEESPVGSLNLYAGSPNGFDDEAREVGLILAAHASVAARAVRERTALEQLGRQLHEALSSRDVIGQAKGILMERLHMTPEDAFDALRRSSQQLNSKLRDVALLLTESGEFHDAGK